MKYVSPGKSKYATIKLLALTIVCSNGDATYIIGKFIVKDNLNIETLMQTCETLLLQNYSTKFLDITHKYSLGMCNNVSSNSGTTYIIGEIIAKENLSIAN